jgi:cytoskeletal protein CcmA (bactofilin family)
MFNLKPDNDRTPFEAQSETDGEEAAPVRTAASPSPPAPPVEGSGAGGRVSVLASDLTILGEGVTIVSQNKVRIEGKIRADVHAREVVIDKEASVTGEVWAERVDVMGEVNGSVIAVALKLHDSASVKGEVMHQKLSIAEGARFDGAVQLIRDPRELMPMLEVEALAGGEAAGAGGNDGGHETG